MNIAGINFIENKYIADTEAYLVSPMKIEDYERGVVIQKIVKISNLKPTVDKRKESK